MDYTLLSKAPVFKGVTPEDIKIILDSTPFRIRNYQAGSMISQSGEQVNSLMVVMSGTAKGEMVDFAGRVIKIEDIPAPGALASAFVFGNRNKFPVNVIAVTDVELLSIEKPDFLKVLMTNDILLINFLDMISNRSQFLSEKIKFLSFKSVKGKLAHFILQKAGKDSTSVVLGMTQNELADFFGVARPSVARGLGDLASVGYIEVRGKNILVLDKEGLSDLTVD